MDTRNYEMYLIFIVKKFNTTVTVIQVHMITNTCIYTFFCVSRMVVFFVDCCKKVELHDRLIKLKVNVYRKQVHFYKNYIITDKMTSLNTCNFFSINGHTLLQGKIRLKNESVFINFEVKFCKSKVLFLGLFNIEN